MNSFPVSHALPHKKTGFYYANFIIIWGKTLLSVILSTPNISEEKPWSYFFQFDNTFHILLEMLSKYELKTCAQAVDQFFI
jgi:hypothetical protein